MSVGFVNAYHEVLIAWFVTWAAAFVLARLNVRLRRRVRQLEEELDLAWSEYERACGTIE